MIGIGISVAINNYNGSLGQTIALNHYNRVTAAGGVLPCGVAALAAIINAICTALGLTTEAQFNAAVPQGLDPHYSGYLAGAGSGTTLGQACQKIFNWAGASGDVSQGTAGSMPLLLAHTSGNNYLWNGGVNFNYVRTPNAAANSNSGDKEIIAKVDFKSGAFNVIFSKDNQGYCLFHNGLTGLLTFNTTTDLTPYQNNFATIAISTNYSGWIKATAQFSGGNLTIAFYTSSDGITYSQVGSNVVIAGNNFINMSSALTLGAVNDGSCINGKIYRATISNSIGGAPVVDFNPNSYNAATSQSNWTSTTSEVWTLNVGTATTGYKACIVDRTICMGDRTDDTMTGTLSANAITVLNSNHGFALAANRYSTSNNEFIATFAGDYTANNSIQLVFIGAAAKAGNWNKGTVSGNQDSTGTYSVPKLFSYADNIVYGGTSVQRVNATSNSGSYFNGTTNKPVIVSGNIEIMKSGFGNLNGQFNTLILFQDGTKYLEMQSIVRTMNNNFAL
jgi:hypothetical protein